MGNCGKRRFAARSVAIFHNINNVIEFKPIQTEERLLF